MEIIHGLAAIDQPLRDTVVAVGVFDGVHRGHQEILKQTVREALSQGYHPVALTFDIHPSELFTPEQSPPYIASLERRTALIDFYGGIEAVIIIHFDRAFASLSPEAFVRGILEETLGARHVLVGADFCYGKGRAGTVTTLLHSGAQNGFAVTVVPPILLNGERISSTQIRSLIANGDLPSALRLLGHPFVVQGHVVRGKQLGRTLGYPTANLRLAQSRQLLPGNGIYAAWAELADGRRIRSAVSIGTNPTTDQDGLQKIEAYLMDGFSEDLYEQPLTLDFREKLRDEKGFATYEALKAQIASDVVQASKILAASLLRS